MTGEVEERIHKALAAHPLERLADGYRRTHPEGSGISTLRILPANGVIVGMSVVATAEIVAQYHSAGIPPLHATGVQRLNSWAVYGAYHVDNGRLWQKAQYSIYADESAVHLAVQCILNAFGGQLPLGRSTVLATGSAALLKQQRAHHGLPARWPKPLDEAVFAAATATLRERGLVASNSATAVWAELPLSGNCPSRAIDPHAETALLQVNTGVPHPIAGAGYLATISLPLIKSPPNAAELCRRLNELELEQLDFVPRLGAWGLHTQGDMPGYSCFIPCAEPWGALHMALMWWCVRRAAWLRDHHWQAKAGIALA